MTLISTPQTILTECPTCKKDVNALRIDNNVRVFLTNEDQIKSTISLHGCPECKMVFWGK